VRRYIMKVPPKKGAADKERLPTPLLKNWRKPEPLDPQSFPHKPSGRGLPGTIENLQHLLDSYGISVRYDVIRKKVIVQTTRWSTTRDNADNAALAQIVSLASLNGFPRGDIETFVATIADSKPYNPVTEWITSKPWDGKDRLPEIFDTLTEAEDYPPPLKRTLIRKWLLSAVAAATLEHGYRGRGVLTLQGPQRIGKTSWVRALVTDKELCAAVVKIDHHIDANSKDSILSATSHWICEIGELDSSFRKDVARLKGLLTRDTDKVRKPYARAESELPRRTVFAATVNDARFLVDDTGNSRFWTIAVTAIDWQHSIDMQQLFAQLAVDLAAGAEWWLTAEEEELLEAQNRPHRTISAVEDLVLAELDLERIGDPNLTAMTPRELLVLLEVKLPTNQQCKECAGVLRTYLGEPRRIQGRDKWRIPFVWERQEQVTKFPREVDYDSFD
jgi:predicted P-loop ATPase